MDADSALQKDSLELLVRPILEDENVVACGGFIRLSNAVELRDGVVQRYELPKNMLASMQVLEYDRSFLASRIMLDQYNGNLIISGAFGLFQKELVLACNGYDINTVGDYKLKFNIKDKSGNEANQDFILRVIGKSSGGSSQPTVQKKILFEDALEKYKTNSTKLGIDVSQWQGDINWDKVKDAGVEFAMIRMGYQKGYDGDNVIDPYFIKNITGAKKAGIKVGIYYYSYAKKAEEAKSQAEWVASNLKDYEIDLPVSFDWESWSSFVTCNMSFYDINKVARTYCDTLKAHGYQTSLYSSKNYLEQIWLKTEYPIWLAHYTYKTSYSGKYSYWQMCNDGRVDGIYGDVDINIRYK